MAAPLRHFLSKVLSELEDLEEVLRWFQDEVEDLDTSEAVEAALELIRLLRELQGDL